MKVRDKTRGQTKHSHTHRPTAIRGRGRVCELDLERLHDLPAAAHLPAAAASVLSLPPAASSRGPPTFPLRPFCALPPVSIGALPSHEQLQYLLALAPVM